MLLVLGIRDRNDGVGRARAVFDCLVCTQLWVLSGMVQTRRGSNQAWWRMLVIIALRERGERGRRLRLSSFRVVLRPACHTGG